MLGKMQLRSLLRHKWKFFIFSTLVKIIVVVTVVITTGNLPEHFISKRSLPAQDDGKSDITFDDYYSGKFSYRTFYPQWVSDTEYAFMDTDHSIKIMDLDSGNDQTLLASSAWDETENPYSWSISPDHNYVIITSQYIDGYAHYVRTFNWTIYDTLTGSPIDMTNLPAGNIQKFKWSQNGHSLGYVRDFNLFISIDFGVPSQLTSDGEEGMTFNGITDWLYVAEITDDDALFWWSPDDTYLAFATISQTGVRQLEFSVYDKQYPTMVKLPYPKPGTPIPHVSMYMVDLSAPETNIPLPIDCISGYGDEFYLNIATWRNDKVFTAMMKNRRENKAATRHYSVDNNFQCDSKPSIDDVASTTGWLGHYKPHDVIPMTSDEYGMVNSHDGYPHIQVINWDAETADWRTSGNFEVTDISSGYHAIFHYDVTNDWIYYTSTETEDDPGEGLPSIRHLWRVKGHGEDLTRYCVTCQLNNENRCNWVTPSFSSNGKYLVVNCGGTIHGVPITVMMKLNAERDYELQEVLENNDALQTTLENYNVRNTTIGSIKLDNYDGDDEFYYIMFTPPNLDPNKKYPLLVEVYSGPGYQRAYDRYSFGWKDWVASSQEVIVMSFDGRGTGYRGDHIMHQVYKNLGQMEPTDQIEAARKMGEMYEFVDTSKTAIWGWSYGGYATTRTIEMDSESVFKCGFAVAPVTDWKLYHTIYTERYMWEPNDNPDGYKTSTALQQGSTVGKHRYVVLHGTRDENVHFQNAAKLEKYLVDENIDFGAYFFADNDHGMGNTPNNYRTVYKTLTREMQFCFDRPSSFGDCCA